MRKGMFIIVVLLLTVSALSYGLGGWVYEEIEAFSEDYYGSADLALDSDDEPYIVYSVGADIKYAYKSGSVWQVETVGSSSYVSFVSIALDSNENPHIAYGPAPPYNTGIYIVTWNGTEWESEFVDTGRGPVLRLKANDDPCIAYVLPNGDYYDLVFASREGSVWNTSTVYEDYCAGGISLALDSSGKPHITFHIDPDLTAFYAYWDNGWETIELGGGGMVMGGSAITLDANEYPYITYGGHSLEYAYWNGSTWTESTIDGSHRTSVSSRSIALDTSLSPHIAYSKWVMKGKYDAFGLAYAHWYGSGWIIEDIDTMDGGLSIFGKSIRLDSNGNPHIAYFRKHDYCCSAARYVYYDPDLNVEDNTPTTPTTFSLSPAYPNPSSGSATIGFALPRTSDICLELFDIKGRKVATLAEGTLPAGEYERDVSELASGVYLYRLTVGEFAETKKMVVR